MTRRARAAAAAAVALCGSAGLICAGGDATCAARRDGSVRWIRTAPDGERAAIDRWCGGVGPPARIAGARSADVLAGPFAIVTWNTHVGGGHLERLVADLRAGRLTGGVPVSGFVLLLQEVYRAGPEVPAPDPDRVAWASAEGTAAATSARESLPQTARRLGLDAVYVPSMRNGAPLHTDEDRGNAIVASVPLSAPIAIELPLERQRRVAVQATVRISGGDGRDVDVAVVDTHFTNMVMHHLGLLAESGRLRQAQALSKVLPPGPLVVGGDFNAWFGFHDAAYRELAKHAAPSPQQDRRATFGPLRLDHLLFRLPAGWTTSVRRAEDRYGSDHYPLAALIERR
jgi:endonuclease/exonuclease/phosphatase family metal-dependent hydrolase